MNQQQKSSPNNRQNHHLTITYNHHLTENQRKCAKSFPNKAHFLDHPTISSCVFKSSNSTGPWTFDCPPWKQHPHDASGGKAKFTLLRKASVIHCKIQTTKQLATSIQSEQGSNKNLIPKCSRQRKIYVTNIMLDFSKSVGIHIPYIWHIWLMK